MSKIEAAKKKVAYLAPLFKNLRTNDKVSIQFNTVFVVRRLVFVAMLIFLVDYSVPQIFISMALSMVILVYTLIGRPFETPLANK